MGPDPTWRLPDWSAGFLAAQPELVPTREARLRLAIALSARNVAERTGGPFGAAIFEIDSGRLVSVGVNAVVPNGCSHVHAEMMAIARAQRALGVYDLGGHGLPAMELCSSCEPCAMCFGAIPWSGVRRLVCAATEADARAIGFDEGPRPEDWIVALEQRGIEVVTGVCRSEASQVLAEYGSSGGEIYNARQG